MGLFSSCSNLIFRQKSAVRELSKKSPKQAKDRIELTWSMLPQAGFQMATSHKPHASILHSAVVDRKPTRGGCSISLGRWPVRHILMPHENRVWALGPLCENLIIVHCHLPPAQLICNRLPPTSSARAIGARSINASSPAASHLAAFLENAPSPFGAVCSRQHHIVDSKLVRGTAHHTRHVAEVTSFNLDLPTHQPFIHLLPQSAHNGGDRYEQ